MAVRYLIPLAVLALQGCITNALWHEEEAPPDYQMVSVPCEALEVTMSADADDPSILVRFSPTDAPGAAPQPLRHLMHRNGGSGLLELEPGMTDRDWRRIPGAELFAPSSWDLRVTSGTYFEYAPANAQLEFHGVVQQTDLGELVQPEELPPALRQLGDSLQNARAPRWQSHCLETFRAHAWLELLSPMQAPPGYRQVPLAWVDRDLNAVPTIEPRSSGSIIGNEEMRNRLRGLRLLARLDDGIGNLQYVLIRVPVLLQGTDLDLQREGAEVYWTRSQLWVAHQHEDVPADEAWIPFEVPMRGQSFDYRWFSEIEESELMLDSLRTLVTPITAALDFAIMTNGPLSRLASFIAGDDNQAASTVPTVDR